MGILTTQDSARAFSTYVASFGLALLIAAGSYLKELNNWSYWHSCVTTLNPGYQGQVLCSDLSAWRAAAIIGIVVGVVDVLVVPFLLCCSVCLVCGCGVCLGCVAANSTENATDNRTTTTPATNDLNGTAAANGNEDTNEANATATTAGTEEPTTAVSMSKFNLKNLPTTVATALNVLGWTVWVFLPLMATFSITILIYKTGAIRTIHDNLYRYALTLFVCALLNLMVFLQKFVDSVCKFVSERICGTKVQKEKQRKTSVVSEV